MPNKPEYAIAKGLEENAALKRRKFADRDALVLQLYRKGMTDREIGNRVAGGKRAAVYVREKFGLMANPETEW